MKLIWTVYKSDIIPPHCMFARSNVKNKKQESYHLMGRAQKTHFVLIMISFVCLRNEHVQYDIVILVGLEVYSFTSHSATRIQSKCYNPLFFKLCSLKWEKKASASGCTFSALLVCLYSYKIFLESNYVVCLCVCAFHFYFLEKERKRRLFCRRICCFIFLYPCLPYRRAMEKLQRHRHQTSSFL